MSATKALVAYHHATYGGVYYSADIDFTNSAVQPTWTRYATTGLANNLVKVMQNDPVQPYDKVYVQLDNDDIYLWNGASWTKIMDLATARTLVARPAGIMGYIAQDKLIAGHIYIPVASGIVGTEPNIVYSFDYGATWNYTTVDFMAGVANSLVDGMSVADGKIWYCSSNIYRSLFYYDGAWNGDFNIWPNTGSGGQINIDPTDPTACYYQESASDFDLKKFYVSGGSYLSTLLQNGSTLARCYELTSATKGAGAHWFSGSTNGKQRIIRNEPTTNFKMYQTSDGWANLLEASPTSWHATIEVDAIAQAAALEDETYVLIAGGKTPAGANLARVFAWIATNNTSTSLPWHVSGTNHDSSPYTDAIPSVDAAYTAIYGVFVGEAPATKGVFVYADEQGDITDIPDYDGLGTPLFGDRSSWRDLTADGFDIYHAQDVEAATPQLHAPWPAGAGTAPVSDGSKYVATDIATQAELNTHIALLIPNVHTGTWDAHKVLIGPTTGVAATPTIRLLILSDLPAISLPDLSDVSDSMTPADNDILGYSGALSAWISKNPNQIFDRAWGAMYQDDVGTTIAVGATDTDYIVTGMSSGILGNVTFQSGQELVISVEGIYEVNWSVSFTAAAANQEFEGAVGVNGVRDPSTSSHAKINTATDTTNIGATGLLSLVAGDLVQIVIRNETSAADMDIEHANISIVFLGLTVGGSLLLETGDALLLETGDNLIMEA